MEESNGYAEQCKDWSEEVATSLDRHVAQAATHAGQTAADLHPTAPPWLLDYAVYTLWQTPLSLCDGTWAWAQVLSLSEPRWTTPDPDLCSTRHGGAGAGAVSPTTNRANALRRAVRHWLRITHAPRGQITRSDGVGQLARGGMCDRYHSRRSTRGQHVGAGHGQSALAHTISRGGPACPRR
jgi:hypothetical protein